MSPLKKGGERKETTPTSIRLTPTAQYLWGEIAEKMGLSKAGVLETLIREKAKQEGVREQEPSTSGNGQEKP